MAIAERGRDRAASALRPRISAFGSHTRYSEDKSAGGVTIQPSWTTDWGARVEQSITVNGREFKSVRQAALGIDRARHDLNEVRAAYLFDVAGAYYDVLKAAKNLEIAEANVRRLEAHLESVKARLEVEDVAITALYRAEAELSQSEADRISSENRRTLALAVLARMTGLPGIGAIQDPGFGEGVTFSADLAELQRTALANRPELKSLAVGREMADIGVDLARSAYWPVVSAEGLYMDRTQDPEADFSAEDSLSVGLTLTIPIYEGGLRRADVGEAVALRGQSRLAAEAMAKTIAVEVTDVYLELLTHQGVLASLRDRLRASRENYNAVARQFEYGLANSVDVMDANTVLVTSEERLAESRYDFQLALLKLRRVTGTFMAQVTAAIR